MKSSRSETEYELKMEVSKVDLEKVFRFFARKVRAADIRHKCLPRDYYDTPNFALDKKGESLRTQYKQGRSGLPGSFEQTYKYEKPLQKGKKSIAGALVRGECPNDIPTSLPDIDLIEDKEAKNRLLSIKNNDLMYVFTAVFERRFFELSFGRGKEKGTVELAFDLGGFTIRDPDKFQPMSQIEIELKGGSDLAIEKAKRKIREIAPKAKILKKSKSAQGCAFYRQHHGK